MHGLNLFCKISFIIVKKELFRFIYRVPVNTYVLLHYVGLLNTLLRPKVAVDAKLRKMAEYFHVSSTVSEY